MTKCKGCGITLQYEDKSLPGYTTKKGNELCERCFRIKHYNEHKIESKLLTNVEILKNINNQKIFTFFLCDFFELNENMINLYNLIDNGKILVITKADIIPKNIVLKKLCNNIKLVYGIENVIFYSKEIDYLKNDVISLIKSYDKVLFSGPTSSGKSSLINDLFAFDLTVSNYENTTQDFIKLEYDGKVLIDAPGFVNDNFFDGLDYSNIKPRTIKLFKDYMLKVGDYELYFENDANLTMYFVNGIDIKTMKKKGSYDNKIELSFKSDITFGNIGFIYLKENNCFINKTSGISVRRTIVGRR